MTRTTEYRYNVDGLLEELVCRNGEEEQVTTWEYGITQDASGTAFFRNDLVRSKIYPDGGGDHLDYGYNWLGEVAKVTDQNGSIHEFVRDSVGRLTADKVTTLGSGVDGAIRAIGIVYTTRGEVNVVTSYSDSAMTTAVNSVSYTYNGFGQAVTETQVHAALAPRTVTYTYEDPNPVTGVPNTIRRKRTQYPGGRLMDFRYDDPIDSRLDRVSRVVDATGTEFDAAAYSWLGVGHIVRTQYGLAAIEMTALRQTNEPPGDAGDPYVGLDRFGRLQIARWLDGTGTSLERVEYGFDRVSNRTWRRNLLAAAQTTPQYFDEHYGYDGLYQVTGLDRGALNTNHTAIGGVPTWKEGWDYDEMGNWLGYETAVDGTSTLDQERSYNAANELQLIDELNTTVGHDAAGNMTRMPKVGSWSTAQTLTWDAWNRLVKIMEGATLIGEYSYDGLSRRIRKTTMESGSPVTRDFYYNDQWQMLEERPNPSDTNPDKEFVWGIKWLDDLILRDDFDGSHTLTTRRWALNDGKNITAVVVLTGSPAVANVVERYAYHGFGTPEPLNSNFTVKTTGLLDWETRFCGYRWDSESGMYQVRYRYYHSEIGRWLSRDPIGESGGGNLFVSGANTLVNTCDELGLRATLQYQTTKFERGWCGHFRWDVKFIATDERGMPLKRGWVYQEVTETITPGKCLDDGTCDLKGAQNIVTRKREGWSLNVGNPEDTWSMATQNRPCCGKAVVEGKAYITYDPPERNRPAPLEGVIPELFPLLFQNGLLNMHRADFFWLGEFPEKDSNVIERKASISWNCCRAKTKTVVELK